MLQKLKLPLRLCLLASFILLCSCKGLFKKVDVRETPQNAQERAKKNVEEGRGASIGGLMGRRGTNYEFSTSNPLWRASLEILDFLPLTTVDYGGGIIITEWYYDNNTKSDTALKITVRFLSNEIQTNSFKVIVHQRKCATNNKCSMKEINSKIKEELIKSILTKAALIKAEQKISFYG